MLRGLRRRSWSKVWLYGFMALAQLVLHCNAAEVHPLAPQIGQVRRYIEQRRIEPSGLKRGAYLPGIRGIVSHFRNFQVGDGRIIDPFLHRSVAPGTAHYAWSAAVLLESRPEPSLQKSAIAALEFSLRELAAGARFQGDAESFLPVMLAYRSLRDRVDDNRRRLWETWVRAIDPEQLTKSTDNREGALSVKRNLAVALGDFLRHQAGFVDLAFVESQVSQSMSGLDSLGLYRGPDPSLTEDLEVRVLLALLMQQGYYRGGYGSDLAEWMDRSIWTSLLIQSPLGEWALDGPTSQTLSSEARECALFEIYAARKYPTDPVLGRISKRAAGRALQSLQLWVRPSRDVWPTKNRFDPSLAVGRTPESSYALENLTVASWLATAWLCTVERIGEAACPAEVGGFAFELEGFHQIIANAGGLYVQIRTQAGDETEATGLVRLHRKSVSGIVGPSAPVGSSGVSVVPGIVWRYTDTWQSLAELPSQNITNVLFELRRVDSSHVQFSLLYQLSGLPIAGVRETYELTPERLRLSGEIEGKVSQLKVQFPAIAFDGLRAAEVIVSGPNAQVQLGRSREVFSVEWPPGVELSRSGAWILSPNGFYEVIEGLVNRPKVIFTLAPDLSETEE